ncbi:MAG: M20/M25/M40 family metallo-hydrolase [Treponema sp.]|nr:M20/M25/M40 family metallo-hydrolase [Treponema sp.]
MDFLEKFRESLKIPTWWPPEADEGDEQAEAPLLRFQEFLARSFPEFHKAAERWVLSPYSVIYHLPGTNPKSSKSTALFLAHYDVVPAETEKWSVDPFGAELKDGFIYSRGSIDMKQMLIGIMEAAENLCTSGWKPEKDIWFAFGGDEERNGVLGAVRTVKWFNEKGIKFDWIIDEGTPIAEKQIKGIDTPLALVSIEEKGYVSFNITVEQEPGHASRPPDTQAAAVLGEALRKIAKKPFPFMLGKTVEAFFKSASRYMPGIQGFVMRHARALGTLFFKLAATNPTMKSMLRNTVAMTQLFGSAADNVMPSEVRAVINLRLLWPWTVEKAAAFIEKAINDKRVKLSVYGLGTDPVPAGKDYMRYGWPEIESAVKEAWPDIPVMPFIMIATTDSRHYQELAKCIFRFSPYKLDPKEMSLVHAHDERISQENLLKGLKFYTGLMRSL